MKFSLPITLFIALSVLLPVSSVQAGRYRDYGQSAAVTLEKEAEKLRNDYKDYLKDNDQWKPRGREAELYKRMDQLKEAADSLGATLSEGWGRKAAREYSVTMSSLRDVSEYIGIARSRRVQQQWNEVCAVANRLSRHASSGGGRDYRDDRDYQDISEDFRRDERDYRDRRDSDDRRGTIRFW